MENKYLPDSFFQLLNPNNTSSYNRYIAQSALTTQLSVRLMVLSKINIGLTLQPKTEKWR